MPQYPEYWAVTGNLYTAYTMYLPADISFTQNIYPGDWADITLETTVQQEYIGGFTLMFMRTSEDFEMFESGGAVGIGLMGANDYLLFKQDIDYPYADITLGGYSEDILTDGSPNLVSMRMTGNVMWVSFNGGEPQALSFRDALPSGGIGLGGYDEVITHFDNIKVFEETQFRLDVLPSFPYELEPGEYLSIATFFEPRQRGCFEDSVLITTNDAAEPEVEVTLTGCGISNRHYVKMNGDDSFDGLSWHTAKATVQGRTCVCPTRR